MHENPGYKMIKKINLRHHEFEKNTSKKDKSGLLKKTKKHL